MSDFLKNVVTFGGHRRTQRARQEYDECVRVAQSEWSRLDRMVETAQRQFKRLDSAATEAARVLQEHAARLRFGGEPQHGQLVLVVTDAADGGSVVSGVAVGAAAGLATSSAVAGAVGVLGTASTGTAIASLAGAAKTSATLAWLGGGSLATGGGGVLVGTMVSSAMVLVPAAIVAGIFSHRKASRFEAECERLMGDVRRQVQERSDAVKPLAKLGCNADESAADLEMLTSRFLMLQASLPANEARVRRSRLLRLLLWPFGAILAWLGRRRIAACERARSQLSAALARQGELWRKLQAT